MSDWMLEVTLEPGHAVRLGMGTVSKQYEDTTLMTAVADFEAVLRVDMEIDDSMIKSMKVEALS